MHERLLFKALVYCLLTTLTAADPVCSSIFGSPNPSDCEDLAIDLLHGWPGEVEEKIGYGIRHVFALPGSKIPSWIGAHASYRDVVLPKFAEHQKEPECMMSLMPNRGLDGQVAVDVSYYHRMSPFAQSLNHGCVRGMRQGGFTHVGSTSSLILAFYAPKSPFHEAILQWRRGDPPTCQAEAPSEDIWTGASGSLGAGSCSDTEQEFWDSLSDIESLHSINPLANLTFPTPRPAPRKGEACFGPVNVCATEDGSRCLAQPVTAGDGEEGRLWKASCELSHFANDGIRPGARLLRGEDPTPESGNPILSNFNSSFDIIQSLVTTVCPCNATYVSESCCSARSGMVWEAAKMKVGELEPQ